jgi:hypothetical protein
MWGASTLKECCKIFVEIKLTVEFLNSFLGVPVSKLYLNIVLPFTKKKASVIFCLTSFLIRSST